MKDTLQYIFDYSAEFLMEQGRVSKSADGDCAYNGEGGLHCAIGCLLKDGVASDIEGKNSSVIPMDMFRKEFVTGIIESEKSEDEFRSLLSKLQMVHDDNYPDDWISHLFFIAESMYLDPGILVTWWDD